MKHLLLSFIFLTIFSNCSEKAPLSGNVELAPNSDWAPTIYLIQPRIMDEIAASFAGAILDSAKINADGTFSFEKMPDAPEPVFLELAVQKKGERFLNRKNNDEPTASNYFPIIWKNGDHINIHTSISEFQNNFSINNPSPENAALIKLKNIRSEAFQKFMQKNNSENHDAEHLLDEADALLNFQKPMMGFAEKTEHLFPALLAVRWVSPENDFERVPEFLFSQCQKWKNKNPENIWVAQLCAKSDRKKLPILKGDKLPDYPLPMLSGETTALYKLIGERLTILDLWASWCAPCRKENRNYLVPLWDKYHEKGFQIIGYALDGNENAWKKAIEKDGASRWPHASHLQGDDAPLMEVFRIQTIPANFILDADGKVVAKNLHGEELVEFVDGYMGE